ncbi:hypothetical protein L3X38_040411 [Prunus dulcis]|uniref:Uncharacterized protein n=1 Tax=Prunus dulcis TaxID=3755 RepID=A0AAD4V9F6_PRUDU|nr:hypothetical protein L3X38_040411 [Prunus dulcis]
MVTPPALNLYCNPYLHLKQSKYNQVRPGGRKIPAVTANSQGQRPDHTKATARARFMKSVLQNYWEPPLFECCNEEVPSHLKLKAAAEHAAEGALWYLRNGGYISSSD